MSFTFLHSRADETSIEVPAIGLTLRVPLPPAMSGGTMTAIETVNAPGFGPPLHRHHETEVFRVLEGRYLFACDGRRFEAGAGDVVSIPGGAAHTFVNITDKPARQFILILPGLDAVAFFTGLAEVMHEGVPDQTRLAAFGEKWGVEFLGPPLAANRPSPDRPSPDRLSP
ncbi:quercetin dioxygenase-like cupin family protein [Ancylobacter sp. 3268]|uniref:cupin domain-containing protein n=1 Tax=Ancylobacter sp. 3268 TaxID=2817752 RepID=UPI00286077FF|nr:cupin domain-containing protein [Ancylobacter sp. 3268]MDR6955710.1 quercetin dioxygenase-like cupin family protein [Ancylobacter sp. 3268]